MLRRTIFAAAFGILFTLLHEAAADFADCVVGSNCPANCDKFLSSADATPVCTHCKAGYFPPPLPTQFSPNASNICTQNIGTTSTYTKTVYITNTPNSCRSSLIKDSSSTCTKHPQLIACACPNYSTVCGPSVMDGTQAKPYDSFFEALLSVELEAKTAFNINVTFLFLKSPNYSNVHEVIMNEYQNSLDCIGSSQLVDEHYPLHFFAQKNANIIMKPAICTDSTCFSAGEKVILNFKKFAFHLSTFGSISLTDITINGYNAVQETLKSTCTYQRGLECCNLSSSETYEINDGAYVFISDADRLVFRSLRKDVCSPLIFFVNQQKYPPAGSDLLKSVVEASQDFRLDLNKYVYRHFGLFNVEYNQVSGLSLPQPQITFEGVLIQEIHLIAGIYTESSDKTEVLNYGYNTIRSIIQVLVSAKVSINGSTFRNSFLTDGFLSNLVDYSAQHSSLYSVLTTDCQGTIPCSSITLTNSFFTDYNNLYWRQSDADQINYTASSSRGINSYTILLAQYKGNLQIHQTLFTNAVPYLSTSYLFCPYLATMKGYVENDSLEKLWYPGASYESFEYSKIMNSHIVLIQFIGVLDFQTNKFYNNTSIGGPVLTISDLSYTSIVDNIGKKKEILIKDNDFQMNVGILSGSVIRILRRGFDIGENMCGPILVQKNTFKQNFGCRSNFGALNIHCLFGSTIDNGIKKVKNIILEQYQTKASLRNYAQTGLSNVKTNVVDYLTIVQNILPYQIVIKQNVFRQNYSPWASALYISGAQEVLLDSNVFNLNGVIHQDIYFLFRNTYYNQFFSTIAGTVYYASLQNGFIADDGTKFLKETSAVLLDLCDSMQITANTFKSNWSILTGDSYIGSSLNIFRAVSFHGLNIFGNTFTDHQGIPDSILFQNAGTGLKVNKGTSPVLSVNVLSYSDFDNSFDMNINIEKNTFDNNAYYVDPAYVSKGVSANVKFKSYMQSYPEINMISLIKFYYNFDLEGSGPNARDPQQQISDTLSVTIVSNIITNNSHKNSHCMIHLINGEKIVFEKNTYTGNNNNYAEDSIIDKQGIWGQICTTDRLGILAKTGSFNSIKIQNMVFQNNIGKIITHYNKVSQLFLDTVTLQTNDSQESLIDIVSQMSVSSPTTIKKLTATSNTGLENGVVCIMDSEYVSITQSEFRSNVGKLVSAISLLDSYSIQLTDSSFVSNSYDTDFLSSYLLLKPSSYYFSSPILANSSSIIINNSIFDSNKATHGGAMFLSSFSTASFNFGSCSSNTALTGGCFYMQKSSTLNTQNTNIKTNTATLSGGAIALFDTSEYTDDSDSSLSPAFTTFYQNIAESGGAIYSQTSQTTFKQTVFKENTSLISGSVAVVYIGYLEADEVTFEENESQGSALISFLESTSIINKSTFKNNQAASQTYGIKSDRSTLTVTLSTFSQQEVSQKEIYFIDGGFISLSEGSATISESTFTKGAGLHGGAIYSGFETVLNLLKCTFTENTSLGQGGSVYSFISSSVTINECAFSKSTSVLKGSDYYGENTKDTLLLQSTFSNIQGTSIYGLNLIKLRTVNSTFANESDAALYSSLDEITTESRGIQCELCTSVSISGNTYFKYLSGIKGAGLLVDNEYRDFATSVSIKNTYFYRNRAYQGGGAYLGGNVDAVVEDVTFEENQGFSPDKNIYLARTSGIGGGLVYDCPRTNPSCTVLLTNAIFLRNNATVQGGGFQWKDRSYNSSSTYTFLGNTALYGPDIASYAVCVIKVTALQDVYPDSVCYNKEVEKGREIVTRFNVENVASGQNSDNANYYVNTTKLDFMSFVLVDHRNRRIKSDSYSKLTIVPVAKLTQDTTGWEKIFVLNNEEFASQGFFSFSKLTMITVPGSIIELSVITDGIPFRLDRQMIRRRALQSLLDDGNNYTDDEVEENEQPLRMLQDGEVADVKKGITQITQTSDATVQVQLRKCKRGEIMKKDYTCYLCPNFKFSLEDDEDIELGGACTECNTAVSTCIGGYYMGPKPEYWRLDSFKKTFHKCPKANVCLGTQDLTFKEKTVEDFIGKCKAGHEGNLCDSCIDGWAMFQNKECVECNDNIVYWIRVAITITIAFVQIVMAIRGTLLQNTQPLKKNAILMKMIMNFVQSIFIFTSYGIQLPNVVSSSMSSTNEVIAAPLQVFNFDCIFKAQLFSNFGIRPYFAQTIILSLIPIVFSLIAIGFWFAAYYIEYGQEAFQDKFYLREITNKITVSIIIVLFTLLPKIIDLTLRAYKCVNLSDDDDPKYFLKADYEIQCWDSEHWYFIIFVAVPSLLIWGIVGPLQLYHFFTEKREHLFEKEYIEAYGFLLRGYSKKSIGNEFIIFYRKIILILIGIYIDYSSLTQVLLAFGVMVVSLAYNNTKQPYADVVFNNLETRNLLSQCTVLIALLYISASSNFGVQILFLLVLIASYIAFIGNAAYYYLKETLLDVFAGFYNNVNLYNLLKMVSDKTKVKFFDNLQKLFKDTFLPLDYDHRKEMNKMFTYLEQNMNLMDDNFAKEDQFIHLKRNARTKAELRRKLHELKEQKRQQKKQKKIEQQREKQSNKQDGASNKISNLRSQMSKVEPSTLVHKSIEMEQINSEK